ncbi:MAG: hypothetical protein LBO00_08885, partial [Zoogloeaceae bacterium]|nr:hypothetical protein [Zoogloeaceae bacterium]
WHKPRPLTPDQENSNEKSPSQGKHHGFSRCRGKSFAKGSQNWQASSHHFHILGKTSKNSPWIIGGEHHTLHNGSLQHTSRRSLKERTFASFQ